MKLHKRISRPIKRVLRGIGKTAGGDNKAGEAIHGVLDLLPIPNQPLGKLIKAVLVGDWNEAKVEVNELLTVRNAVAVIITGLIVSGLITIEQVQEAVNIFETIIGYLSELGIE